MPQSDSDRSRILVATLAEPPQRGIPVGCIAAVALAGMGGLCLTLLIGMVWLAWFHRSDSLARQPGASTAPLSLRDEAAGDIEAGRLAATEPKNAQAHPEYDRIVQFIDSLQAVLDDTANPGLKPLVDYDRLQDEVFRRAAKLRNSPALQGIARAELQRNLIGPTPFSSYEVTRIENDGPHGFRVHLSFAAGYPTAEPHIWWLSDLGRIRIYDWSQLELGLRVSAETAALYDASESELRSYNEYVDHSYEYLATEDQELSYVERKQLIKDLLAASERYRGPAVLRPSVNLITARRWQQAGEDERALALLDQIPDPSVVPGVYRLRGDIQFARGEYEDAVASYRAFIALLGPVPHAQRRLAACFREMGDSAAEREALLVLTRSINERNFAAVAQLIEVSDVPRNRDLFSQLDALPCRDDVYLYLVERFAGSVYFADRLQQIHAHLQRAQPLSAAAILAGFHLNSGVDSSVATMRWIDENCQDDPDGLRYGFWYHLDETQIVQVLESSDKLAENFDTICEVSDFEGSISDEVMLAACELVLRAQPDNYRAHYQSGAIFAGQRNYSQAITSLRKSLETLPDAHDLAPLVRLELLSATYRGGDRSAALELATDAESAAHLLAIQNERQDFSDFSALLARLGADSDRGKYYRAMWNHHQGDTDAAVSALVELVSSAEGREAKGYEIYSYGNELADLCEQQGDVTRAFTLVPTDAMFRIVSRRLLQDFDCPNCGRFLRTEALADKHGHQCRLRQQIAWEQGQYQHVVVQGSAVLELAKSEDSSEELERLVRAALRSEQLELARNFAHSADILADRHHLLALVALRQGDRERATSALRRLGPYEVEELYHDPDLMHSNWRDLIPAEQMPRRGLSMLSSRRPQFALRMLFTAPQLDTEQQLQATFAAALNEDVRVERVTPPEAPRPTWVVQSRQSQIFIVQRPIDGGEAARNCEDESLQEAIRGSAYHLDVVGYATGPTTAQSDDGISAAAVRSLHNDQLCAVGSSSRWLTAADVRRWLEQPAEQRAAGSSRLFGRGEFAGVGCYLHGVFAPQSEQPAREFLRELVAALKRFESSADADRTLTVQFTSGAGNFERLRAMVHGVCRTENGWVSLDATLRSDARFDQSLRQGDKVLLPLDQIDSFDLRTSGEAFQRDRSQN